MNYNNSLQQIPVVAVHGKAKPDSRLHWARRAFQWGMIALFVIIPLSGLFRIDPVDGAFVVLDRQIWFSDFYIVIGFWAFVACSLVLLYSVAGTVFCGWACPQNTFSEWANMVTRHLLGNKAEVSLDGSPVKVARRKNTAANWIVLGVIFLAVSMLAALIPLLYFYEPGAIWSFITFRDDSRLAGSLHWIYTIFVLIILLDIAFIRHFVCRFMCIYKVWQHTFKTRQTLHIAYDKSRSDMCTKCGYCVQSCFLDIDPRKTDQYDTCINCGECVTACGVIQHKKKTGLPPLLRFEMGQRSNDDFSKPASTRLQDLFGRVVWMFPVIVLAAGMFVWGLVAYQPYHFAVYRADTAQGDQIDDYRINVAHKKYRPAAMTISVEGLPPGSYTLEKSTLEFPSTGRQNVHLVIHSEQLKSGLHPVLVRVTAADQWSDVFRVHHLVNRKRPL